MLIPGIVKYTVSVDNLLYMQEVDAEDVVSCEGQLHLSEYDLSSSGHEKFIGTSYVIFVGTIPRKELCKSCSFLSSFLISNYSLAS